MSDTPRTDQAAFPILARLKSGTEDVVEAAICRQLERELAAVTAERDALRQDAERYRWLRDRFFGFDSYGMYWAASFSRLAPRTVVVNPAERLDAAIDASIAGKGGA